MTSTNYVSFLFSKFFEKKKGIGVGVLDNVVPVYVYEQGRSI